MSEPGDFGESDLLGELGYPLYQRLFSDDGDFVRQFEETLAKARISDPVELFLSRAVAIGVLVGVVTWLLGSLLGYALFALGVVEVGTLLGIPVSNEALLGVLRSLRVPLLVFLTGLVFGVFGFGAGFGTMLLIPYMTASSRKREINMLLPDAVSFMYALSIGGLNQLEIIEAMARAEDTYGEVAREFKNIVQETKYFDTDYRTAIRQQSLQTPSEELSQFLTDMLSIINSGGDMTSFLDDKKDKHMRTAKQQQETTLETLELFGEMYMTLSLFPLLLVIVMVIMSMLGRADTTMLYGVIYGLLPVVGVAFLVLISTVKEDEPGDGYLKADRGNGNENNSSGQSGVAVTDGGVFSLGPVERFTGEYKVFNRIRKREGTYLTLRLLQAPHLFFKRQPLFTLGLTVPGGLTIVAVALLRGAAPTSWSGMISDPVWGTFIYLYLPLYIIFVPLAIFYEWNLYSRRKILTHLSDDLRKLSSANDTGLTLLESIRTVAETSTGTLADEFQEVYAKVQYGESLKQALIGFNNKYHIPRLARTVKLITKAQEASSQITDVLTTAAQASENQDDIERERKSRTRMQVVIILMTYFTLLAVMAILKTQFLDVMSGLVAESGGGGGGGSSPSFGASIDTSLLSLMFFHAVTIQAVLSGFIAGYIRDAKIMSGVKFTIALMTVALVTWIFVG